MCLRQQEKVLHFLLKEAQNTEFGKEYKFSKILKEPNYLKAFQKNVPISDYKSMKIYWERAKNYSDVCWLGKINLFALTSGTSGEFQKFIPVSETSIKMFRRESIRAGFAYLKSFFWHITTTQILGIAESTHLNKQGNLFLGYASGILMHDKPWWESLKYKPSRKISDIEDWDSRINAIVENAPKWNIGTVVGIPSNTQQLFERILERYNKKTIHDIWPNFKVFIHGGTYFEPYRKSFEKLLKYPIADLDVYAASEGQIAYQRSVNDNGMKLILDQGVFFEFIPFNEKHFDSFGKVKENTIVLTIDEIQENTDYALVISTVSGAWRYVLGDLVSFTSKEKSLIKVTGRTESFLNFSSEHVTGGDLDNVITAISKKYQLSIKEYTVAGFIENSKVYYHWFIGSDETIDNFEEIKNDLDVVLRNTNAEYNAERNRSIAGIYLDIIPLYLFFDWLRKKGKKGAQIKFPKVLKGNQYQEWKEFIKSTK